MKETPQKNRTIMSVLAIIVGLLMVSLIPFLVQTSLEKVLVGLIDHINAGNPTFTSGVPLFDIFYPVWRALIFVAGAALIIISQEIRKGEEWTYPTEWSQPVQISMILLIVFGGIVAFTAFNFLLKSVSPEKVATSTYINPLIALALGWYFLNEQITTQSIIAAIILLIGVYFINTKRKTALYSRFSKIRRRISK